MRKSYISNFSCAVLAVLFIFLPSRRVCAGGEEITTTDGGDKSVLEDKGTTQDVGLVTQDVGLGKFSRFPFRVSVSVRGGYDDNVLTTTFNRQGSAFINASVSLTYKFDSRRTQLTLATNAGIVYYLDRPSGVDDETNPNLSFSLTHKATPRLTLLVAAYATYQQQPDFALNAGLNRRSGSFFYSVDKFSAAYQWAPRFSTVTSYTLGVLQYDESAIGSFENRFEQTFGNEFRFLVWPTTTLVGEYRFGIVDYDQSLRNSTTQYLLAGFDHTFSPRFNISTRAGAEFRSYDNFGDRIDPYAEATFIYALGPHTLLTWTNRYSLEEPDVPGSQSRATFRTGLQARYNITPRIVSGLGLFYEHDDNKGFISDAVVSPAFSEDLFVLTLSISYAINRNWAIQAGYDFVDVKSAIRLREYYRNKIYAGLQLSF